MFNVLTTSSQSSETIESSLKDHIYDHSIWKDLFIQNINFFWWQIQTGEALSKEFSKEKWFYLKYRGCSVVKVKTENWITCIFSLVWKKGRWQHLSFFSFILCFILIVRVTDRTRKGSVGKKRNALPLWNVL